MAGAPAQGSGGGKPPLARPASASTLNSKAPAAVVAPHPGAPAPAAAHAHHHRPLHPHHHDEVGGTGTLTPPFVTALTTMAR